MTEAQVKTIRGFNRVVTERIGALQDEYLARARPLGASRVLWEIGNGAPDVRTLRARLSLDSGYLSRLLRTLEADNLIAIQPSTDDSRVRSVSLTARGRSEFDLLDHSSDTLAKSLLTQLSPKQRDQLVDAATTVERLLTAGLVEIVTEHPATVDARYCIEMYFEELDRRFDTGFDPNISISADADELLEPAGLLLLARLRGEAVGCGAVKFHDTGELAEIKRMWVSPDARRLGIGRRLLSELEERAIEHGVFVLRLETNESLSEAINLYRSAGYEQVEAFNDEPFAHHWFEKRIGAGLGP